MMAGMYGIGVAMMIIGSAAALAVLTLIVLMIVARPMVGVSVVRRGLVIVQPKSSRRTAADLGDLGSSA